MYRQWEVLEGIDASRRVGWAKAFEAMDALAQTEKTNNALQSVLYDLAEAVVYGHKGTAFSIAYLIHGYRQHPR
jgi:hypothetical protein